jgi:hypothetical protein
VAPCLPELPSNGSKTKQKFEGGMKKITDEKKSAEIS